MLHADALFVRRVSVVIVRLLFDLMYVVPAEYAIHVQEQSTVILNTVLARGFGVPLVSLSPLSLSVMSRPSLPANAFAEHAWFVQAQNSVQAQQQEAILRVVGSYLLSFFCPSQQFAAHFIESLHAHAPSWKPSLVQVLRERPEFEKADKLPHQIQISVFVAMELCLRLDVFAVTEKLPYAIAVEASRVLLANSNLEAVIQNCLGSDGGASGVV